MNAGGLFVVRTAYASASHSCFRESMLPIGDVIRPNTDSQIPSNGSAAISVGESNPNHDNDAAYTRDVTNNQMNVEATPTIMPMRICRCL